MRTSSEKSDSLRPAPQSSLKQIHRIRYSQISSLMSMNALRRPSKKKVIESTPKKSLKTQINKVLELIKENKQKGIFPEDLKNTIEKKSKIVKNIFYFQRIAYEKIISTISPYISKKANNIVLFRGFDSVETGRVEYPRRYFAYQTSYILEKKRCRLYSRYKDLEYMIDPNEYYLKYFNRMETKTVMNYLLNCCYNNDPTIYDYDIDMNTDVFIVKNDFDFYYKNTLKNVEKTRKNKNKTFEFLKKVEITYVKDIKYYKIHNIIPSFFQHNKDINEIMEKYSKKKKYEKVKSKYLDRFKIPSKFDKFRKIPENQEFLKTQQNYGNSQISRMQFRENNNLLLDSNLYGKSSDDNNDNDYYNKMNEFNCDLKITRTYKKENTIEELENWIKRIDLYNENCTEKNKKNTVKIRAKKIQNRKSVQFDVIMDNNDLNLNKKSASKSNLIQIMPKFTNKKNNKNENRLKTSINKNNNEFDKSQSSNSSSSSIKKTKDKKRTKTAIISANISNKKSNTSNKKIDCENNKINVFNNNRKMRAKIKLQNNIWNEKNKMLTRENLESAKNNLPFLNKRPFIENKIKIKTNISNLNTNSNLTNCITGNNSNSSIINITNSKPKKRLYSFTNSKENKIRTVKFNNLEPYSNNSYPLKNSYEFIKRKKNKEQIFKNQYISLKNFVEYSVKQKTRETLNKYFTNHFSNHFSNKNKTNNIKSYSKPGVIENEWEKGREDDMSYKNLYISKKIMKKNEDLDRKHKNIFKNLTNTKDILKFGDIYVH